MPAQEAGVGEVYCIECGEVINEKAEICPECGVRQPSTTQPSQPTQTAQPAQPAQHTQPQQTASARQSPQTQQDDYGILYAHVDAQKRKKLLRNLFDIGLIFVSVGLYLGVMIGEGLRHYYKLKRGEIEPYDPNIHSKSWIV